MSQINELRKIAKCSLNLGKCFNVSIRRIIYVSNKPQTIYSETFSLANYPRELNENYVSQKQFMAGFQEGKAKNSAQFCSQQEETGTGCLSYPIKMQTLSSSGQIFYLLSASLHYLQIAGCSSLSQKYFVSVEIMQWFMPHVNAWDRYLGKHVMIPQFISWSISRFHNQLVTRADFGLFPPVLNPLALPAFKTSLSVCTSLCTLKPEDKKGDVALG